MAREALLGEGIAPEDRDGHAPDGAKEGDEEGVGIAVPESLHLDDGKEGVPLDIDREEDDLARIIGIAARDGRGESVDERIDADERERDDEDVGDDAENNFRGGGFGIAFVPAFLDDLLRGFS